MKVSMFINWAKCLLVWLLLLPLLGVGDTVAQSGESRLNQALIQERFRQLRDIPESYRQVGTICERLAILSLRDIYPPALYDIEKSLVYERQGRTLGELDLVVFRGTGADRSAVLIAEVKCWKDMDAALQKARRQLQRFADTLDLDAEGVEIYLQDDKRHRFATSLFSSDITFAAISYRGTMANGFDYAFPLSLAGAMELRDRLLKCQEAELCPVYK